MTPREFLSAEFFLEGILTPILGIFGFFGNVLSIKVREIRFHNVYDIYKSYFVKEDVKYYFLKIHFQRFYLHETWI